MYAKAIYIRDLPKNCQFVSDSLEVDLIAQNLGIEQDEYDSFWVVVKDGFYHKVFGMFGDQPYSNQLTYTVK